MKKRYIAVISVAATILMAALVYASAWEWVVDGSVNLEGLFKADCPGTDNNMTWKIATSDLEYEYVAFYLMKTAGSEWVQVSQCDWNSLVNGITPRGCSDIKFTGFSPGDYYARITINNADCGTYTPTPDLFNCGDVEEFNLTLAAC